MLHNVQFIELFWTVVAILGLIFATLNFGYATKVIRNLKTAGFSKRNDEWRMAHGIQVAEFFRFIIQTIHTTIGVIAFSLPPSNLGEVPTKFQLSAFVIRWGIVISATLTALQSVNSYRLRRFFLADHNGEVKDDRRT